MARKVNKPRLKVNSFFLDEMSVEQAFADFFYLAIKDKPKSSVDTIGNCIPTDYNAENTKKEENYVS